MTPRWGTSRTLNLLNKLQLSRLIPTARWWGSRGSLAVLDQGLFSGSNFALNVLLARKLSPRGYGAFALSFAILVILIGFHNAWVFEPMSVFGPSSYRDRLRGYFRLQLRLHHVVSLVGAVALLLSAGVVFLVSHGRDMASALLGCAVASPLVLLLWLARRYCYVLGVPGLAAIGSTAYLLSVLGGFLLLSTAGLVSPLTAFALVGLSCLVGSAVALYPAGVLSGAHAEAQSLPLREIVREQFRYGRWLAGSTLLVAGATQGQLFLIGALRGLSEAGALRAMQVLTLPIHQTVTAVAVLGLPVLAGDFGRGRLRQLREKGYGITAGLVSLAILYEVILVLGHPRIVRWVYGGTYVGYAWLAPLLGVVPVLVALTTGASLMLRAARKPQQYLVAGAVTAIGGIGSGLLLVPTFGLMGAAFSIILAYAFSSIATWAMYRRWLVQTRATS